MIFFIMRMLGEMAVDSPVSGSFSYYATKYWGKFPGFLAGWNYWFEYIIVSMAELTVVGIYINFWFPDVPQWVSALICLVIITTINKYGASFSQNATLSFVQKSAAAVKCSEQQISFITFAFCIISVAVGKLSRIRTIKRKRTREAVECW